MARKAKVQPLITSIAINEAPTFTRYGTGAEKFALRQAKLEIEAYARKIGADRVYVTKNLTGGSRPLMFKFYSGGTKFVRNNCLNTILSNI